MNAIDKPIEYIPIDISKEFLFKNAKNSAKDFPDLKIKAICADFNQVDMLQKFIGKNGNNEFVKNELENYIQLILTCNKKNKKDLNLMIYRI